MAKNAAQEREIDPNPRSLYHFKMQSQVVPEWKPLSKVEFVASACPVCKSTASRHCHDSKIAGYEMQFRICADCDALYTPHRATVDSLREIYGSKDFFASGKPGGDNIDYFDFIGGEKYLRLTAKGRLARIRKYRSSGRMLEVASAAGFFLVEAKNAGYDVSGVEFSAPMARYASERWKVPVIGESIELVDLKSDEFDIIASWGVMTILQDPVAAIRKFHRALKPGGLWAFNTYYHDGLWHRLMGHRWSILGVQMSQIYSSKLILDLVSREGFQLLHRRRDTPHTDLLKIADQLAMNTGLRWLPALVQKARVKDLIVQVPLPDVYEYVWRKV